ncbi:hypothetical protein Rt10032_c02g0864 [Rhodotorula toruloides]|uniref:Uncharacterized protein n=1 Tax=Rhodotorula toruloides TaxID=5286 RepID=A0A511K920_RHOTO|nr:hypothetical protein Rt10032_c02g0864 [Rhodotorula toruloides]
MSRSVQAFPSHSTPTTSGISRSPAISSISSSRTIKASLSASTSRPPAAASNPSNRHRHARSQSTTSTSSRSSVLSSQSHDDYPSQAASWSHARSPVGSPSLPPARPSLAAVDWSATSSPSLSSPPPAPRPRLRTSSESEGAISWSIGLVEREVDEQEKEAKVERRIADLEIRNASLLSINTSLERLKVKHTNEIRELRRKLRESLGGAGLAALRVQATKLVEVDDAGGVHLEDLDDEADSDGEREEEQTWQELLDGDPTFSALAGTVEALIARAKRAVKYEPAGADVGGGRVLSIVEMEDRLRMEDGGAAEDEEELSSGVGTSPELSRASTPATSAASSSAAASTADKGLGIRGWQRHPR